MLFLCQMLLGSVVDKHVFGCIDWVIGAASSSILDHPRNFTSKNFGEPYQRGEM